MTLPSVEEKAFEDVKHPHFVIEMGEIWLLQAGLNAVIIPYNATDAYLDSMLAKVNGVFFTGGDIDLYDPVTGQPH